MKRLHQVQTAYFLDLIRAGLGWDRGAPVCHHGTVLPDSSFERRPGRTWPPKTTDPPAPLAQDKEPAAPHVLAVCGPVPGRGRPQPRPVPSGSPHRAPDLSCTMRTISGLGRRDSHGRTRARGRRGGTGPAAAQPLKHSAATDAMFLQACVINSEPSLPRIYPRGSIRQCDLTQRSSPSASPAPDSRDRQLTKAQ